MDRGRAWLSRLKMGGKRIEFSREVQGDIVKMYKEGMEWKAIQERHGISSPRTLKRVLADNGIDVNRRGKPLPKGRKCSCGHTNPVGRRFCNQCGERLLTADELVIEGLLKARNNSIRYMPANMQSEADEAMLKAINLLKIKCGVV